MANRKRNIQMKFYVTEEEKRLIDGKMAQLPTRRYGAYLRKMAIDGYIIQLDTTDIKRMNAALSAIGRNINQIAKRINAGGGAYKADMREIQERLDEKKGRRRKPSQGKCSFPCSRQRRQAWNTAGLCGEVQPSAERTTPARVYKCALVAKGLFSLSFPRLVFSKTPALVHSSRQVGKRSARPRPSW